MGIRVKLALAFGGFAVSMALILALPVAAGYVNQDSVYPSKVLSGDTLSKSGGTMESGAIIDMNGGYIYDSTDSVALGGTCTSGISGDACINSVLFTSGVITTGIVTAQGGLIVADDQDLSFGDDFDYWFEYDSTPGAFRIRTTDSDGAGSDAIVATVVDGTNDISFTGEVSISGVSGSQRIVCVKSTGDLGTCTDSVAVGGTCNCN